MDKFFNIEFPFAGVLKFSDVSAENREAAISKCFAMVTEAINDDKDPIQEFDGEWEMYEKLSQGNVVYAPLSQVSVSESE